MIHYLRLRGGVAPVRGGYVPVVHGWHDKDGIGNPDMEWLGPVFATEAEAWTYYNDEVSPALRAFYEDWVAHHKGEGIDETADRMETTLAELN